MWSRRLLRSTAAVWMATALSIGGVSAVGQDQPKPSPTPPPKKDDAGETNDAKSDQRPTDPKVRPDGQPVRRRTRPPVKRNPASGRRRATRPVTPTDAPSRRTTGAPKDTSPDKQTGGPNDKSSDKPIDEPTGGARAPKPAAEPDTQPRSKDASGGDPGAESDGLDPDLQKRIDALLEGQLQQRSDERRGDGATGRTGAPPETTPPTPRRRTTPGTRSSTPPVRQPTQPGDSEPDENVPNPVSDDGADRANATLNIPPVVSDVAPQARTYRFSIKGGTYEQLVEGFARQTGLGVLGDAPKDGRVTFVTTEELSFDDALSRVRTLLFNYKPHDPYWIVFEESNLRVVRVADYYRTLPRDRMFNSIAELRAANLPGDELVLVIYTPKSGSLTGLKEVRDHMPDYLRVDPLEDQNRVTIYALVSDIDKYIELIQFFEGEFSDPRTTELIEIQHILPSEALSKLQMLMDLDGDAGGGARPRVALRGRAREPGAIDVMPEPDVTVMAEDAHGYILVRAMQGKIDEIRQLLPFVDIATPMLTDGPVVIPVKYAEPATVVNSLNQILTASASAGAAPVKSRTRRGGRTGATTVSAANLTLLAHPSQPAIIVMGDEEQVAKVRGLVEMLDTPDQQEPVRIPVENVDAAEISQTVMIILGGSARGKAASERFYLSPDPSGSALWFTGNERDLQRVRDVVAQLDTPTEPVTLHIVQLRNQKPSFITDMLKQFEGERITSQALPGPKGAARGAARRTVVAGKFTSDDVNRRLFVLCTNDEWSDYQSLIDQLDGLSAVGEPFERITLSNVDAHAAVERLRAMVGELEGRGGPVRYLPTDGGFLVVGATEEQLVWIRRFLPEVDWAPQVKERTFEIHHADPAEIKTLIETLVGSQGGDPAMPRRPRRAVADAAAATSADETLTVTQYGRRLIVQATPADMTRIEALITQYDVDAAATELRIYDSFSPGTDIVGLSETLKTVLTGDGVRIPRGARPKSAEEADPQPTFIPQPGSNRLVVIAEPSAFREIERLLDVLKTDVEFDPIEVVAVTAQHVPADALIETIEPLIELQVRDLVASGELDEPVEGVAAVVKSTRRPRGSMSGSSSRYHVGPAGANTQIVIAGPKKIVQVAKRLIEQFDAPGAAESAAVMRTVVLSNTDAAIMVKAIKEMKGTPTGRARPPALKTAVQSAAETPELSVVEAPTGGAIVLRGTAEEVEEAVGWIEHLDSMTTRGRAIKVYEIQNADITRLVDLIMNVVDEPEPIDARRAPRQRRRPAAKPESEEEDVFATTRSWTGDQVYIQADFVSRTMLVATSEARMSQIDGIIEEFNNPEKPLAEPPMPSKIFKMQYAEASAARWDLDTLMSQMWQPSDDLPHVESSLFGNSLVVRYHDADRFGDVEELVRMIDRPSEEDLRVERKGFRPPEGISAQEVAIWLKMKHPEYEIDVQDISEPEVDYGVEKVGPPRRGAPADRRGVNPCVLPGAFARLSANLLVSLAAGQADQDGAGGNDPVVPPDREPTEPVADEAPADEPPAEDPLADEPDPVVDPLPDDVSDYFDPGANDEPEEAPAPEVRRRSAHRSDASDFAPVERKKVPPGQKLKVYYDNAKGVFVIEGPSGVIEEMDDSLKELEEELDKFPVPPDIRIYRVRYIDVNSAKDILEEMFNATKQQRAAVQAAQQRAQQLQRQQAAQQRRQAQQPQPRDKEEEGGADAQRGRQQQRQQPAVPQLPPTTVRIFANPRDRTLILRADASQYPAILELLATIDQPKPFDSEMRIYPLQKLSAVDVEQTLSDVLGLGGSGAPKPTTTGRRRAPAPSASGAVGAQLPQTIMQEMVSGTGSLGVDPEDIQLSSNEAANTIIAVAPPAALDFIGEMIDRLESADVPERFPKHYELQHADAEELSEYLATQFAEVEASGGKRRGGVAAGGGGASGTMNAPSFTPYPPLNLLTVQATEEDLRKIDELVGRIDVAGAGDQWEDVGLRQADAKVVADTLTEMFAGGGASSGARGKSGSATTGTGPKFLGDEGGRILFFSSPPGLREQILATVAKLEAQAADQTMLRVIELQHAVPSKVAEAIEQALGGGGGSTRVGKKASADVRFTVTAADSLKRIFVRADEKTFAEIDSLAQKLDVPHDIGFDFRIYKLQYADAKRVHEQMTKLMTDFLRRVGKETDVPPFSVEADVKSNALIVLGSPMVFGFLEENLAKIDTPANAAVPTNVMMVPLQSADAREVAQNISNLWGDRNVSAGETPPQVEANQTMNMLIVRGSQTQLDEIKATFIDPLDDDALSGAIHRKQHVFRLTHADATAVATELAQLFKPGAGSRHGDVGPVFVGDAAANALVAHVNDDELDDVRRLVTELDEAGEKGSVPQIITLTHAKVGQVLPTLQDMFAEQRGGPRGSHPPVFGADEATNRLIVRASPTEFHAIEAIVKELDTEDAADKPGFRIIQVPQGININDLAEKVETSVNEGAQSGPGAGRNARESRITVTPDNRAHVLIVSGTPTLFDQAEALTNAIAKMGPSGGRATTVVRLKRLDASDALRLIDQLTGSESSSGSGERRAVPRRSGGGRPRSIGANRPTPTRRRGR